MIRLFENVMKGKLGGTGVTSKLSCVMNSEYSGICYEPGSSRSAAWYVGERYIRDIPEEAYDISLIYAFLGIIRIIEKSEFVK